MRPLRGLVLTWILALRRELIMHSVQRIFDGTVCSEAYVSVEVDLA